MASGRKSILIIPSRIVSRPDNLEGGEETEITAQVSVPHEGGWGWVVVICALSSILILDGVVFTFGSLLKDMSGDLDKTEALIALVNSIAVSLYFMCGPVASALINRYGFRACTMTGSIICSFSLFNSYFTTNYTAVCILYGVLAGFGYSLINLSCSLIVGFYFEKLRSIALSITSTGSSIGIMCLFPLNTYLVSIGGWRLTTLLHSGLFGLIFFFGMAFKPLVSLSVIKSIEDPTRTVTYLPSLSTVVIPSRSKSKADVLVPTATERFFSAVSNVNFPTVANVIEDDEVLTQPGPSSATAQSKLTLVINNPQGGINRSQLKQVQSTVSSVSSQNKNNVQISISNQPPKKSTCWARLCHWEKHADQSRPLYRDDAFYQGDVKNLHEYQKSMMDTTKETRTGLEYRLAVSRAAAVTDLQERRGIFTTAARRVLSTMMDPKLLRKCSFLMLCLSGFFTYVGFLVPYVYLKDRNSLAGIDHNHCTWFVSAIGLSNVIGRIVLGFLACKIDPLFIAGFSCIIAGLSTCLSSLSYSIYYQYAYCFLFGFGIAWIASLRSVILVSIYGLDNLTNATGIILLFQGLGSLLSTPIAGVITKKYGYPIAFIIAGAFITLSGIILLPVRAISKNENNNTILAKRTVSFHEKK